MNPTKIMFVPKSGTMVLCIPVDGETFDFMHDEVKNTLSYIDSKHNQINLPLPDAYTWRFISTSYQLTNEDAAGLVNGWQVDGCKRYTSRQTYTKFEMPVVCFITAMLKAGCDNNKNYAILKRL